MASHDLLDSSTLLQKHGKCFFMFVLQEDMMPVDEHANHTTNTDLQLLHHLWLVPIPRHVLPYQNQRRNTKLFKYHGHFLFCSSTQVSTTTIIWQDAKFFQRTYIRNQPRDYTPFATLNHSACLTVMTLPVHANTFGIHNIRMNSTTTTTPYQPKFIHHCETILDSLQKRPNVTDSPESLMRQCKYYLQQQQQQQVGNDSTGPVHMDHMLLDSAFLLWNYSTKKCRTFNAQLQCTLSEQIHCHSDRDQVSFPYAMAQMGLQPILPRAIGPSHPSPTATPTTPVFIDQRQQDVQLVRKSITHPNQNPDVMVHMIKSACHWYFRALDDCPAVEKPSIAILVAGSTRRFQFTSMTLNVLQPLAEQNYNVDVYAMFTQQEGPAYRQNAEYMQHVVPETFFRPQQRPRTIIKVFRQIVEKSGAFLRGAEIRKHPLPINSTQLGEKRREAKRKRRREDADYRFPMLDLRPNARRRTAVGNQNILNLFYGLQYIWDEFLIPYETSIGKPYDYVMIVREDALWLAKFDMAKLLAINPEADAFVQSCDARNPPMLDSEINDHGIVIKRSKAEAVGRYFSSLLSADLESCHAKARRSMQVGELRGCNSEMILKWILEKQNITVQGVPQSILPFERAMSVRWVDGNVYHCFHKFCQSKELPLHIEANIPFCKDLRFSTNSTPFEVDSNPFSANPFSERTISAKVD
jgi:hypothetical protein